VAGACAGAVATPVEILDGKDGKPIGEIFCQLRDDGETKYLVAMNINRSQWFKGARVRVKTAAQAAEWDCVTGQRHAVNAAQKSDWAEITCDFPPSGEHVFVFSNAAAERLPQKPAYQQVSRQTCEGPFSYSLGEKNVCVLDLARYQIGAADWQPEAEVLKVDRAVRKAFGLAARGGEMVQPWYRNKQQPQPAVKGPLKLAFSFHIETMPKGPVLLGMERPELWQINLNGQPVTVPPKDRQDWWVDPALATLPVENKQLRTGDNTLEMAIGFHEGINIEAVYLLGDFGVTLDGVNKTLTKLPETLKPGDLTAQGLPFYTGPISYFITLSGKPPKGQRAFLATPKFEAACIKVHAGKRPSKMIAWQPYEAEVTEAMAAGEVIELEVVLTRRNTFGPLHLVPLRAGAYGPDHWVTEGQSWSQNYMLYPSGLLEAPVVSFRQTAGKP
jgi:hypothetical protein